MASTKAPIGLKQARCLGAVLAAGLCIVAGWALVGGPARARPDAAKETPMLIPVPDEQDAPELALLMGELQRLTHKMALSADVGNAELAAFYLHESLEQLRKIQQETPEYEGIPVALFVDRMGLPAYETLQRTVLEKPANRERLLAGLDLVITGCNACHAVAQHGFIRITRGTGVNPFNQSFSP